MERREFIKYSVVILTTNLFSSDTNNSINPWDMIHATLSHMFPTTKKFHGANDLKMIQFIKNLASPRNPEKNTIEYLTTGAKRLYAFEKNFLDLNSVQKEKVLRDFEKQNQSWLSNIQYYGFEAMLGDPLYGANKNFLGWKNLNHSPGLPRPQKIYAKYTV